MLVTMDSLNDRYLRYDNGDRIAVDEVHTVNERLTSLVREIEVAARAAAVAHDIPLNR